MKVLFAVNNENISEAIIKMYQKNYKEIITYKNVYYFNAIIKELQRDKTYDRVIISEDLEPFSNNNYDVIDKFIFEKLDKVSDEATNGGNDIPIILICTDRREKSEQMLVKLFGIGVYNAILGNDRSVEEVCSLLKMPRNKKDAKDYYKIDTEEVGYQPENEDSVSEMELQNILAHYKKLGKDEDRYVDSFNNIAAQYNDAQLRLIARILPLNVKAVLEARCPKYQSIMTFRDSGYNNYKGKQEIKKSGLNIGFIKNNKSKMSRPVVIPSALDVENVKKIRKKSEPEVQEEIVTPKIERVPEKRKIPEPEIEEIIEEPEVKVAPKRGRGRPKKIVEEPQEEIEEKPKRGRGRPRKIVEEPSILAKPKEKTKTVDLFDLSDDEDDEEEVIEVAPKAKSKPIEKNINPKKTTSLFDLADDDDDDDNYEEEYEEIAPKFNKTVEAELPGFDEEDEEYEDDFEDEDDVEETPVVTKSRVETRNLQTPKYNGFDRYEEKETFDKKENKPMFTNTRSSFGSSLDNLLTGDKKIVSFVGTSKNGTSFLVNNLAQVISAMGIKTAILDATKNKNSYYIYTKNEETLRKTAYASFENLRQGKANGIEVNRNLSVYTSLPGEGQELSDYENILTTLVQNYSLVLIDCDFETQLGYFEKSNEIYLVQSMDILTIQPLTAFLRDLKSEGVLEPEKLKIVINKYQDVKTLSAKAIVGGLAFYNDPAMSFMTELFNKDTAKFYIIPFDMQVYAKYLEGLVNCEVSVNRYTKEFMSSLKALAGIVYPLVNNKYSPLGNNTFSNNTNSTLNRMKNRY